MKFDPNFTRRLGEWLQSETRDTMEGAMLLLRLTGNRLQYAAIMTNPEKHAGMVGYQLQRHYDYRVAALTAEELARMKSEATAKATEIGISEDSASATEEAAANAGFGKRADHDRLPEDIRAIYVTQLEIRRKMQQLHLIIRTKYAETTDCTASDVYAFVKELLRLEQEYTENWAKYDTAKPIDR